MIKYILEYINSRGNTTVKMLTSDEEQRAWAEKLDKRIEKGTCGGYIITAV